MHVIGLALTYLDIDQIAGLAAVLLTAPLRDAVHCIFGRCPSGMQRVLRRLPSGVLTLEAYKSLIELLDDPRSARILYHLDERELTGPTLRVLREVPAVLRPTLTAIVSYILLLDGFSAGLQWLAARRDDLSFDQLVADLARQSQPAQLIAHLDNLVSQLPLPDKLPAKTIGNSMRIDTAQEICALAKEFKNGLASYKIKSMVAPASFICGTSRAYGRSVMWRGTAGLAGRSMRLWVRVIQISAAMTRGASPKPLLRLGYHHLGCFMPLNRSRKRASQKRNSDCSCASEKSKMDILLS